MDLLEEAFEAVLLIQRALGNRDTKVNVAEKEWLALWGIHTEMPEG